MTHLHGRALVIVMCIGQLGNLLPHVAVPAIMAQHLIPLWKLSATQAGLMASAYAVGYMLSVPVLTEKLVSDSGASATDKITANPALTGTADPNAVVHFTVDGSAIAATATKM